MSFPKYPEYKDSGVEWLREVPAHWNHGKVRYFAKLESGHTPSRNKPEYWENCTIPWFTLSDVWQIRSGLTKVVYETKEKVSELGLANSSARLLPAGTVILSRTASVGYSAILGKPMATTQDFANWICGKKVSPEYLLTAFRAMASEFSRMMMGSTHKTIYMPDIAELYCAIPPMHEQSKIVAFLDHETARIDALIAEQQRLIELLKEKRQAVISHAVTKGLDSGVPMKDSGVEWLGEVPEHWEITRVKHIVQTFEQGWSPQCENNPVESESEWGVLKVGCVNHGRFDSQENKKLPGELSPRFDLSIKANDVLISRANTRELVGSCAVPTVSYPNLMLSDKLFRLRLRETVADPIFLAFFMGASQTRQQIELEATGASSSMLNIGQGTVLEMPFPCPPLEEQARIRDEVIKQTWSLLNLAGEALELKKRLEERRSALISAAVTGKIDVRGWQPPTRSSIPAETDQMEAV
ncbi:restriction endonuclease subunit S [Halomonas sp. McH1-25]|uniref:restriction endonuclease subunit S n=1 Tax=unclassified Halomonas TaxID=2609666 RepID=UPI001EF6E3A0|nr:MULTISPECIES: restriction endonuclease subunit S [unclassified Halomonas]MCG7602061.1 restriction endonuclease subunit S [Halomonas sp. McH1-25]MCP1342897.1 restriction endonuclease subunit S [Halomonas sp. FL8]MCP1361664.1 restriction endonuclease subunit S [Halomonas sp. BBD45]MCP1363639.1 restriction endonuclease subunit S [Halomonas sp. BBD48]